MLKEFAPSNEETKKKIKNLFALPEIEKTFKNDPSSFKERATTTFAMSNGKDPSFIYFIIRIMNLRGSSMILRT